MRYELSDSEWATIKPLLPNKSRGVRRVNDRRVLNGIFWVLRSGAPWRDLPRKLDFGRGPTFRAAYVWDSSSKWVLCSERLLFQLMDVTGKAFWRSRTIAQQISWPARACAPAGGQEISGSSRACNVCSADSNAETRGGKSRVPSPSGTPRSTAPALPSCISWFETRLK